MQINIFNLFKKRSVAQPLYTVQPPDIANVTAMKNLVALISKKHKPTGFTMNAAATLTDIARFEQQIGFPLPEDFKAFYIVCNGFGCTEDIFNMTPLEEISNSDEEEGVKGFHFAEYMINSDMWGLRFTTEGNYEIFNASYPLNAMTSSLEEFLNRFLLGNVFEKGGLYYWMEELKISEAKK